MTKRTNGPWTIAARRSAYANPWIDVEHHDVIRPDGSPGVYGVVRFANLAIGVLPLFADGTVPLVGQFRFPLGRTTWELPEGGGPKGEAALTAAKRELREETGLTAEHWQGFGEADLSNSVTDERCQLFVAWGLTQGPAAPEPDEVLEHRRIPFAALIDEIHEGRIDDALTQLLALTALSKALTGSFPQGPRSVILDQMKARP